jgi:hypothetical protein
MLFSTFIFSKCWNSFVYFCTHSHFLTDLLDSFAYFIIADKARAKGDRKSEGVGVMKDKVLELEETEASHTLGG